MALDNCYLKYLEGQSQITGQCKMFPYFNDILYMCESSSMAGFLMGPRQPVELSSLFVPTRYDTSGFTPGLILNKIIACSTTRDSYGHHFTV